MKKILYSLILMSSLLVSNSFDDIYRDKINNNHVQIYDKKTSKLILNVKTEISESSIIYDDFNFDGKKDLAIYDGRNSCYGGPSYQVYLQKSRLKFQHNESLTRLAQEYCGFFTIDKKKKQLRTMTKSGAAWHQYNTYVIKNNVAKCIVSIEESFEGDKVHYKKIIYDTNNKKTVSDYDELYTEDLKPIFSFKLDKKKKWIYLFSSAHDEKKLVYAFVDKTNRIELMIDKGFKTNFKEQEAELLFTNGATKYKIYEVIRNGKITAVGVEVNIKGTVHDLKGTVSTVKGRLNNNKISTSSFSNVRS